MSDVVAEAAFVRATRAAAADDRTRREVFRSRLHEFEFITRFQPGHGFTLGSSGPGTVEVSSEQPLFGSQGIKFTRTGGGNSPNLYKLNLTLDLTRNTLAVWVRRPTGTGGLNVYAGDNSLANYYYWNAGGTTPVLGVGEWDYYLLPLQGASVTGSPNPANITRLQFSGNIAASDSEPVYLGAVAQVENSLRYPNGVVSITFDDSQEDAYAKARPMMDAYGYGGTSYLIANTVATENGLTLAQLHRLEDLHGWEIAGHCFERHEDWTTLSAPNLEAELTSLRAFLMDNNFRGQDHLAYPYGAKNEAVKAAVRAAGFYSARVVTNGERNALPPEPARLHELNTWNGDEAIATNLARLENVAATQGWGVFMFHTLDRGELTSADFATFLAKIHELGLAVAPVGDVLGTWDGLR